MLIFGWSTSEQRPKNEANWTKTNMTNGTTRSAALSQSNCSKMKSKFGHNATEWNLKSKIIYVNSKSVSCRFGIWKKNILTDSETVFVLFVLLWNITLTDFRANQVPTFVFLSFILSHFSIRKISSSAINKFVWTIISFSHVMWTCCVVGQKCLHRVIKYTRTHTLRESEREPRWFWAIIFQILRDDRLLIKHFYRTAMSSAG